MTTELTTHQQRLDLYIIKFMMLGTKDGVNSANIMKHHRHNAAKFDQNTWDMLDRWLVSDARKAIL